MRVSRHVGVKPAPLNDALKVRGQGLVGILLLGDARAGDDGVSVADGHVKPAGLVQRFCVLTRKGGQLPNGGVFLEDDLALAVGVDLQRISLADNIDTDRTLLFRYA